MKPILVLILSLLLLAGCNESKQCEEEIYLVPEGFRGRIMVFFDQADGQAIEYENTARVYHIPESGYIKSQFPRNGGCMNDGRIQFFYEDSLGTRQPLDYFLNMDMKNLPTDRDYVLFTFLSDKKVKPDFVIHFVGHLSEFNELTESVRHLEPMKILDSI
ncbi:MAG TPA: hypothetical protein VIN10_04060 [Bacteroidales bacterium]